MENDIEKTIQELLELREQVESYGETMSTVHPSVANCLYSAEGWLLESTRRLQDIQKKEKNKVSEEEYK